MLEMLEVLTDSAGRRYSVRMVRGARPAWSLHTEPPRIDAFRHR